MLEKEICKRCRIKEFNSSKGWNEFTESWFDPYIYKVGGTVIRPGHVHCPYPILERWRERALEKIRKSGLFEKWELGLIESQFGIFDSQVHLTEEDPPPWCPYKKEHKKALKITVDHKSDLKERFG